MSPIPLKQAQPRRPEIDPKSSNRKDTLAGMEFQTRSLSLRTVDANARSVDATLSTENPVPAYDWERREVVPEVLLTEGVILPKQMPLLDNHRWYSIETVLGSIRQLRTEGNVVVGRLMFSSVHETEFVLVQEGHVTDVSVGYRIHQKTYIPAGETREIRGRSFTGPVNVVTRWQPLEGSLTSIGADEQAKLRGMSANQAEAVARAVEGYEARSEQREGEEEIPLETLRDLLEEIARGQSEESPVDRV